MHNAKADRVHIKADGTIEILTRRKVVVKVKEATVTVEEDRIVAKIDDSRHVVRPDYVKLRKGAHWVVVKDDGVFCSVAPVVGPDPEPAI
jgi:hypothetical protein